MSVQMPEDINALWATIADLPEAMLMAGGTDLLVRLRAQGKTTPDIICLENVRELQSITESKGTIRIGAVTTLADLHQNELIRDKLPLLHHAASRFASPLIRNMATIGGNVCTASPAGDTLPALHVMEASVELVSAQGTRTMPVEKFIQGPGRTAMKQGEIMAALHVPVPKGFTIHHFEKVGQRQALAIAMVSLAALVALQDGVITEARLAWGSVGPTVIRDRDVEKGLAGGKLTLTTLRKAAEHARKTVSPISDVRASADYRRQVAGNLLLRLATL